MRKMAKIQHSNGQANNYMVKDTFYECTIFQLIDLQIAFCKTLRDDGGGWPVINWADVKQNNQEVFSGTVIMAKENKSKQATGKKPQDRKTRAR